MPCTNTGNFAETFVRLPRQLLGSPPVGDTFETVTLRNRNDIHNLILLKHRRNLNRLLEQPMGEFDLVRDRTTVDLNLHQVRLLLAQTGLANLSVCQNTDDSAVFANTLKLASDGLAAILSVLLGIASESLLL